MSMAVPRSLEDLGRVARQVWQRRWLALGTAWVVGLLMLLVIPQVPERCEASAKIYVDTQTVLKPLMAGLAFQPDIDQQVRMLAKTWISRPNMERLLASPDLGFPDSGPAQREKNITRLMQEINVFSAGAGNLYTITYRDGDAERARRLVEKTVELFVASGFSGKKQDSQEASRFIDGQIKVYEAKLTEAENRLKDYKMRNAGVTGFSNQDYFARMSTLSDTVSKLTIDLHAAEQARDAYKRELSSEEPLLPDSATPQYPAQPTELDVRLESQRKQLDDLLRRYTEEHPDVISTRRVIAQLEQQKRREAEARAKTGSSAGRSVAATSPVFQRIRVSLAEAEAQVASLRSQLAAEQRQLEQARSVTGKVPQAEADLAQLNRDYDIIRKNYDQLVSRRESASLGLKLDESSQLADFRVVEPPRVSPSPVFPSHLQLAILGVLITLGSGLAAVVVAQSLRPTLDDAAGLAKLTGRTVLGTVSIVRTPQAAGLLRADRQKFVLGAVALMAFQVLWIVWNLAQAQGWGAR
jgi:polysaccharide chain length determinant protein (PEP-CTERM system associated)